MLLVTKANILIRAFGNHEYPSWVHLGVTTNYSIAYTRLRKRRNVRGKLL